MMRLSLPANNGTAVGLFLTAALFLVALIDASSVVMARLSVPDRARDAGYAAAVAVENLPATQRSAVVAYDAARGRANRVGLTVKQQDFRIYPDGRVRLTVSRKAPTVLLHRLPVLQDLTFVESTETVVALPYN